MTDTSSRQVEPKGIYIALWSIADPKKFHWGIFIAGSAQSGYMFHYTNGPKTNGKWAYQEKADYSFEKSISFLAALKISEVIDTTTEMFHRIGERLSEVEFKVEQDNCRTWTLRAVQLLDQEGLIGISATQEVIECLQTEANQLALDCFNRKKVLIEKSEVYKEY
ncbi:hypothetical protein FQN52_002122 [Onygenales sp. PD_12]|nr:hypothetical protein FQN52_002122 [Onygenales sp. PD_12]KAK2790590.1 hypothetical protein FQN53_009058 [Emmonsiellopsis sp. PD_33]